MFKSSFYPPWYTERQTATRSLSRNASHDKWSYPWSSTCIIVWAFWESKISDPRAGFLISNLLQDVHKRAQLLLPFFIDGAESIDQEDDNWELFTAVTTISGQCCLVSLLSHCMIGSFFNGSCRAMCEKQPGISQPKSVFCIFQVATLSLRKEWLTISTVLRYLSLKPHMLAGRILHCLQNLCLPRLASTKS